MEHIFYKQVLQDSVHSPSRQESIFAGLQKLSRFYLPALQESIRFTTAWEAIKQTAGNEDGYKKDRLESMLVRNSQMVNFKETHESVTALRREVWGCRKSWYGIPWGKL